MTGASAHWIAWRFWLAGPCEVEGTAANLFIQLVLSRYEHASLILTSNLPFASWGDVFGDQVVAAAMIHRIVHHAEVITLKGSSHRLPTLPRAHDDPFAARSRTAAHQPGMSRGSLP